MNEFKNYISKVKNIKPTIINEWTKMLGKRIIAKFCKQ